MGSDRYQWQEAALEQWELHDCRGIVEAVTGAGKTMVAVKSIRHLMQKDASLTVAVVVPTVAIMHQWYRVLTAEFGYERTGCFQGRDAKAPAKQITVYVINSARYNLARRLLKIIKSGGNVFLIADECHHYSSSENKKIFEFTPYVKQAAGRYFSLGLSATLGHVKGKRTLEGFLGPVIYSYCLKQAERDRVISEYAIMHISVCFSGEERKQYEELSENLSRIAKKLKKAFPYLEYAGSEFFLILHAIAKSSEKGSEFARRYLHMSYKRKRLVCMASDRLKCAALLINAIVQKKRCIVFGEGIAQIDALFEELSPVLQGRVARYHSKMGKQANKNTLQALREGGIRVLLTCKALDEGLDVPEMDAAVILSGTSVRRQRIQRLGRVLRSASDKKQSCLYYFYVGESMEENVYFPMGEDEFTYAELYYDRDADEIVYPVYEESVREYLNHLNEFCAEGRDGFTGNPEEIQDFLETGKLTGDWLLGREKCFRCASEENDRRLKNYWICMGQLAGLSRFQNGCKNPEKAIETMEYKE